MQTKNLSFLLTPLLYALPIFAMDITLSTADIEATGGLRYALNIINNAPDPTNSISIPFALLTNQQYNLPPIEITNANRLTIRSQIGGTTLNGLNNFPSFGPFRGFFVSSGNVTVQNLDFRNTQAIGGNGGSGAALSTSAGSGGGGGMGAGGALFVRSGSVVTLSGVSIDSGMAQGGVGGSINEGIDGSGGGGGGGMGGHGGSHLISAQRVSGGGGGGLFGSGADSNEFGGAGGGGLFGNGGVGSTNTSVGAGGGGGGRALPPGGNGEGAPNATTGGNGNGDNAGIGGLNMKGVTNSSVNGQNGGFDTGGGGGGSNVGQLGNGGDGGNNGGGGGGAGSVGIAGTGGKGGMYGGGGSAGAIGGGSPPAASGIGDFGGGGGGASHNSLVTPGAVGGFGGGAGGSSYGAAGGFMDPGSPGANGGFGGGGSGGLFGPAAGGTSTAFGGSGGSAGGTLSGGQGVGGGGGGAGLGGAIFIYDGGTLVLQDDVSFRNNTVAGGTGGAGRDIGLPGDTGQAFGNDLYMMSGSQLTLAVNGNLTIASDIVGNNGAGQGNPLIKGLTKLGSGTVSLNGVNTYTANTTVSQGTLIINGTTGLSTNNTIVHNGGTLKGIGTIYGSTNVQKGGIVSPGNSLGTLHILGPFTIQSGGQLTIEANDTTASSLLAITGTASLSGTLFMDFEVGTYSQGQLFTILTATSDISGSFTQVTPSLANLTLQAIYNPNSVQVLIQSILIPPVSILSLTGIRGNAKTVGTYLNSISADPFLQQELIALAKIPSDQLNKALQSISPGSKSFATYVSQNTMFTINKVATTRMAIQRSQNIMGHQNPKIASLFQESIIHSEELLADNKKDLPQNLPRGSTTKAAAQASEYAVWASGLGDFTQQKAENQNSAFHATSPGGLVGVETYRFSSVLVGAAAGYAHSDITLHQTAGHSEIDYYVLGLYETTYIDNGYIEFSLWGTYNQFHTERRITYPGFDQTAHSSHHGWQITPSLSAGYDLGYRWGVLEPFASLDVVVNFEQKFAEKKATPFNMEYPHNTSEFLRFETGLNAYEIWERSWGSCLIRESLSYVLRKPFHVGTVNAAIVGAPVSFAVYSFTDQQNILSPGIEIFFKHKKGAFLSVAYDGEFGFGSGYMSNELIGKAGVYF